MRLESGPAKTDAIWHLGRAVLFLAFTAWFVYDGAVGWPSKNQKEATTKLAAPQPFGGAVKWVDLDEKPTQGLYDRLKGQNPETSDEVTEALGEAKYTAGNDAYFISRYGYAKVTYAGDRVTAMTSWVAWYKTKEEVQQQFLWAVLPALPGLWFLWKLLKALSLKAIIDDDAMTYGGQRIAFDDMVALRDYNPKGWIDLYYKSSGQEKKLRIDNEKIAKFDEIVATLCSVKGWDNLVAAHAREKAEQEADQQAAAKAEEALSDADDSAPAEDDVAGDDSP